jgi:hypothetical protein
MHLNSGLYVYALDVKTGEVLHQTHLAADTGTKGEVRGAVLPDILVSDGTSIGMRTMRFDPDDLAVRPGGGSVAQLAANDGGLLDGTWFNSAFWVYGNHRAQMLAFDDQAVYGIQAYKKFVTKSYPHDIFTPGAGYRLVAADVRQKQPAVAAGRGKRRGKNPTPAVKWEQRVELRGQAMLLTANRFCLAGAPDVVDEQDPWGSFDDRRGGMLVVFSKGDGRQQAKHPLASAPVYDGMAAAAGRLYISLRDGTLVCYGG